MPTNKHNGMSLIDKDIRPFANSTTAIQLQNATGGAVILNVDSSNLRIGIRNTAPAYTLDITGETTQTTAANIASDNANGSNLQLTHTGQSKPNIYIRNRAEKLQILDSDYGVTLLTINNSDGKIGGYGVTAPSNDYSLLGTAAKSIGMERNTDADTAGQNLTISSSSATVGATNRAGGDLILQAGLGTGNASSHAIKMAISPATTAGTGDQTIQTRFYLASTANTRLVIGNVAANAADRLDGLNLMGNYALQNIYMARHTTSNTAGFGLTIQSGGSTSGATDKAGGTLTLKGGLSTGTGASGITFQTCTPAGSTGTADNTFATRFQILDAKIGFFGVTAVARQVVPTGSTTDQVITALQNLGLFSQT